MFWLRNKLVNLILLPFLIFVTLLGGAEAVFCANENITVQMEVPVQAAVCGNGTVESGEQCDKGAANGPCPASCSTSCTNNTCGGGGGGEVSPPANQPPSVSNVVVTSTMNTANITWTASDDSGLSAVYFVYGLTDQYGTNAVVSGSYETTLLGLTESTKYFYKITVVDVGNLTTIATGDFVTLAAEVAPPEEGREPIISNISVAPGVTFANIVWNTDIAADSQINYGLTSQYGSVASDDSFVLQHEVGLVNLLSNKIYHYRIISATESGGTTSTADAIFATLTDNISPPDVSNFNLQTAGNQITLTWDNPNLAVIPDFAGVKILRKVSLESVNINDGLLVYEGNGQTFVDNNVLPNIDYFYTIFSYDTSQNYSAGIFKDGKIIPTESAEICGDNIDNDNNFLTDCDDLACSQFDGCKAVAIKEICDNNIDDDNNGKIDCADLPCFAFPNCTRIVPEIPPIISNIPDFAKIAIKNLLFFTSNRSIPLSLVDGKVEGLAGFGLTIVVPQDIFTSRPISMILIVDNQDKHAFSEVSAEKRYYADIIFPPVGEHFAVLEINYGAGQVDQLVIPINSYSFGQVLDSQGNKISEAKITVFDKQHQIWNAGLFGQNNPQISDANGLFGFMLPNDEYYLEIEKEGYYQRVTPVASVTNNVINFSLQLVDEPPPLAEVIDPEAGLVKNIQNISQNLLKKVTANSELALQKIADIREDKNIESVVDNVVVPTAVGVSVATFSAFGLLDLLAWLRFLFLQPVLLFGRKKREKWGVVYNAFNKLPLDLAVVRLVDVDKNKIVQSRVTDRNGRYIFFAKPGNYTVSVRKNGFFFPSAMLKEVENDGRRVDIYHGKTINVNLENSIIAVNIPIDPVEVVPKTPKRILFEKIGRTLQLTLSWIGIIASSISFLLYPSGYLGILLLVHLFLFLGFRRLAKTKKIKRWGVVYDADDKKPLKQAVVRLFDAQFNKLVDMQITDKNGRYGFLAGDNKYFISYEHPQYELYKSEIIDLTGKEQEAIVKDVFLRKKS